MRVKILVVALVSLLTPLTLWGDVADSGQNGFTVNIVMSVHASPADVYSRLVHHVGDWWSSDHTFSGDAHNLSIEEKPMGCFCEKLPNGGGVRHAEVIYYVPAKTLVLSGALGPLQKFGTVGSLSFAISPATDGSKLEVSYVVGGYIPDGLEKWAAPVNTMLTEQITRLRTYVETGKTGSPEPKKP